MAQQVATNPGVLAAIGASIVGFFGFIGAILKLMLVAAALGTGFGIPIVVMVWLLNRKKS